MNNELENLIARLRDRAPTGTTTGLEVRVWAKIALDQREASPIVIWGWRSAAAGVALSLGLLAEGISTAHASPELSLFSSRAALAPSTLLGESQ